MYSKIYLHTLKRTIISFIFESLSNIKNLMACALLKGIIFNKLFYLHVFEIINLFLQLPTLRKTYRKRTNFEKNKPRNSVSF